MFKTIALLVFSLQLFAFNLSPLSQSIELGKNSNTVIYQIENKNKEPIAIEVSLKKRVMKEDGTEEHPDVKEGEFLVYPTQLILKPGDKRGVKVQYLGSADLKSELAFRILVEQLPIDFKKRVKSGVKLLLRYLGALYITKDEFKVVVKVNSALVEKENIHFNITNLGSKHIVFKNLKLKFNDGDKKLELLSKSLEGFNGENLLAGNTRVFKIKNSENIKKIDIKSLKLDYE